jgi:hypothetical protein
MEMIGDNASEVSPAAGGNYLEGVKSEALDWKKNWSLVDQLPQSPELTSRRRNNR